MTDSLFKFYPGRQTTAAYRKLCFLRLRVGKLGFDGYILVFDPFGTLLIHTDKVENGMHYRMNIKLFGKYDLKIIGKHCNLFNIITLFRPDVIPHGLMVFKKTCILSLGFAKYD